MESLKKYTKLLNLAIQEPVYPESVKTYLGALKTALFDGVITDDEDAMLATLRKSLNISDQLHANFVAKVRDTIK